MSGGWAWLLLGLPLGFALLLWVVDIGNEFLERAERRALAKPSDQNPRGKEPLNDGNR